MLLAAEVALPMLVVAVAAQRGHLFCRPLLAWQSVRRLAEVAEAACGQAAVDARPPEHLRVAPADRLPPRHGRPERWVAGLLSSMSAGLGQLASDAQLRANYPAVDVVCVCVC